MPNFKKIAYAILAAAAIFILLAFTLNIAAKDIIRNASINHINLPNMETESVTGGQHHWVDTIRKARFAASEGDISTIETMLQQGFKIDQDLGHHTTLLMVAAQRNQSLMLRFLVQHNANVDIQNEDGEKALTFAAEAGHVEDVLFLLNCDKRASVNTSYNIKSATSNSFGPRYFDKTLLTIAVEGGHLPLVRALTGIHANINARDSHNSTVLALAASGGNKETVKFLISHQADVESSDDLHYTPLAYARMNHHNDLVKILQDAGATR